MQFVPTTLAGAMVIEPKRIHDERGFFATTFCARTFAEHGLNPDLVQCNFSFNHKRGTLRGMHFQTGPHAQDKLVSCLRGAVYDVAIDLRPDSPTFRQWVGVELTSDNQKAFFVPAGFAHGFITLTDAAEVYYQMSTPYAPDHQGGVRWNDPAFAIAWPIEPVVINARDQDFPNFEG